MENIENKIPNGENQDTQNSSFFSENVSSSNGLEPKIRFVNFKENYRPLKIGDIYAERSERGAENMELLSVTINEGVKKRMDIDGKDTSSEDKSNYKIVHTGDMVYNSMRMWQGANGISDYDGIVSPAYTVLKSKGNIHNQYIGFLFKNSELINKFRKNSQGLTSDTWNLKYPQIACIKINIPSLDEQQKIADFLSLVDQRIEKQRQLVESLKKYKRGALSRVFNDVLETVKLSDISNFISSARTLSTTLNGNKGIYPVYDAAGIAGYIDYYDIDSDYITIVKDGSGVGRLQKCDKKSSFIGTLGALVAKNCTTDFLYAVLQTIDFSKFVTGMAIPHIYYRDYKSTLLPFPSEEKQHFISQLLKKFDIYIENETQKLTNMLAYKQGLLQQMFI